MKFDNINWLKPDYSFKSENPDTLCKYIKIESDSKFSAISWSSESVQKRKKSLESTSVPAASKKVFFSPVSKYPRFKFSSLSTMKKTLSYTKSDIVVSDMSNQSENLIFFKEVYIYKSGNDRYILRLDSIKNAINLYPKLQLIIRNSMNTKDLAERFMALAIQDKLIPENSILEFFGNVNLGTKKVCEFIESMFASNIPIISDETLDKHLSKSLGDLSESDLNQVDGYLKSNDINVVGMGITMISAYNVLNSACSIAVLLFNNRSNIIRSRVHNSVAFKQLLSTIGMSVHVLHSTSSDKSFIDDIYKKSNSDEDKNNVRMLIKNQIEHDLNMEFKRLSNRFKNMSFDSVITIK